MKKTISLTLIALMMLLFFAQPNFAKTKEEKLAEKVKTGIAKLGTGQSARAKIKLKDGSKINGYITQADENRFVIMDSGTNQPIAVEYYKVKQIKGNNLSDGAAILIGIGVAIVAIILLANQLD